jgi:hypothetical protein
MVSTQSNLSGLNNRSTDEGVMGFFSYLFEGLVQQHRLE